MPYTQVSTDTRAHTHLQAQRAKSDATSGAMTVHWDHLRSSATVRMHCDMDSPVDLHVSGLQMFILLLFNDKAAGSSSSSSPRLTLRSIVAALSPASPPSRQLWQAVSDAMQSLIAPKHPVLTLVAGACAPPPRTPMVQQLGRALRVHCSSLTLCRMSLQGVRGSRVMFGRRLQASDVFAVNVRFPRPKTDSPAVVHLHQVTVRRAGALWSCIVT